MGYWEFLLQKKGERSWLPLKKQQLEVEAGYYRMVAHTSRAKTDVEVRLSYLDSREFPAKRRSQKRLRSTNSEGLMVIMPFTLLRPGLWEVSCCGDILSDFLGESWQEIVQLQVVSGSATFEQEAKIDSKLTLPRRKTRPRKQEQVKNSNAIAAQLRQKKRLARKKRLSQFILGSDSATEISSVFLEETRQEDLILGADSPGELVAKTIEVVETVDESPDVIVDADVSTENIPSDEDVITPVVEAVSESPDVIVDADVSTENIPSDEDVITPVIEAVSESPDVIVDADVSTENIPSDEDVITPVVETVSESPDVIADADASTQTKEVEQSIIGCDAIAEPPDFIPTPKADELILGADSPGELIAQIQEIETEVEIEEDFAAVESPEVVSDADTSTENIPSDEDVITPVVEAVSESPDVIANTDASTETTEVEQLIIGCDAIAEAPDSIPTPKADELILGADSPGELIAQIQEIETEVEADEDVATAESPEVISDADTPEELVTPTTSITENVCFTLEKETFVWNLGQPIVISGCIASNNSDESAGNIGFNGQIRYQLRNPQTSDIVVEKQQSVAASNLPVNFSHNLEIPTTCSATLILGEAILETEERSITFANVPFSITAEVSQLLATVDLDRYETIIPEIVTPKPSVPLNLDLLDLANQPKTTHQSEPTSSVVLPPVIKRSPIPSKPTFVKPPELPHFTDNTPPEPEVVPEVPEENNFDLDLEDDFLEIEAEIIDTPQTEYVVEDETEATATSTLEATTQETIEPWQGQTSDTEEERFTDEIDVAFQSLNLESYFWSRLVSLAHNRQLSQSLWEDRDSEQTVIQEPDTQIQEPIGEDSEPLPDLATLKSTPDWSNQEIVVEDEEIPLLESQIPHLDTSGLPYPPGVEPLDSSNLSQEELQREVPTPILNVTEGELTAGKPVVVRIKLPPCPKSVYVKIWVQDRQTRYLLDGPRALVDFTINREGELETLTQVTVPLGSLEIRFEAIAIDIQTQRESRKASVDRKVVPADLPEFSLDEFDSNF